MSHCYHKRYGKPIHLSTAGCEWYEAKNEFRFALMKFGTRVRAIALDMLRKTRFAIHRGKYFIAAWLRGRFFKK